MLFTVVINISSSPRPDASLFCNNGDAMVKLTKIRKITTRISAIDVTVAKIMHLRVLRLDMYIKIVIIPKLSDRYGISRKDVKNLSSQANLIFQSSPLFNSKRINRKFRTVYNHKLRPKSICLLHIESTVSIKRPEVIMLFLVLLHALLFTIYQPSYSKSI